MIIPRRLFLALAPGLIVTGCVPEAGRGVQTAPPPPVALTSARPVPCSPAAAELDGSPRQGAMLRGHVQGHVLSVSLDGKPVPVDANGAFLIAFDRDAPSSATLRITPRDACAPVERVLPVAPGQWDIQRVDASITGSATTEEFRQRRGAELEKIAAARARMTPGSSDGWRQAFVWPVAARISGRFGSQRIYRGTPGSYHSGVDLAAPAGTTYVAPADGVVILAASAPYTLEGNLLIIDHGMGLNSAFLHSQRLLVKEGDVVRQGQPIGIVGATGRATGPHLHWGMKWQDARLDPVPLVKSGEAAR